MGSTGSGYIAAAYERVRRLHVSERGEVWLVADRTGALFVLKEICQTGLPYRQLKEHPQGLWPEIRYCVEEPDRTLVVEEYVGGQTLADRLHQQRYLTEAEAQSLLLQLVSGLIVLHGLGIVHRDIKPSNLILQGNGSVRLIDFDAARTMKEGAAEDTVRLGTKGYAPPEQFGFGPTDARSDLFALGRTMQALLGPAYRGWLAPILAKCTEIDPQRRYASAAALYAVLRHHHRKLWLQRIGVAAVAVGLLVAGLWLRPAAVPEPAAPAVPESREPAGTGDGSTEDAVMPVAEPTGHDAAGQPAAISGNPAAVPVPAEPELPVTPDRYGRRVSVTAFFNGEEAEHLHTFTIPGSDWLAWPQGDKLADRSWYVAWPENWSIRVQVQNYDRVPLTELQLAVTFDALSGTKSAPQIFTAEDLPPGAAFDFIVPLGGHQVKLPEEKMTAVHLYTTWNGSQGKAWEYIRWDVWLR